MTSLFSKDIFVCRRAYSEAAALPREPRGARKSFYLELPDETADGRRLPQSPPSRLAVNALRSLHQPRSPWACGARPVPFPSPNLHSCGAFDRSDSPVAPQPAEPDACSIRRERASEIVRAITAPMRAAGMRVPEVEEELALLAFST